MMTGSVFATRAGAFARRWHVVAAIFGVVVAVTLVARRPTSIEPTPDLSAGAAFIDSLTSRASGSEASDLSFGEAVALGYVERHRLGLGSPFRLAEYALRDPRLDSTTRRRVAAAIFVRTLTGRAYVVDPAGLASLSTGELSDSSQLAAGRGAAHLAVIERALADASDPRAGELALRLAYAIAAAERSVDRDAVSIVAPIAALLRDRRESVADARRLLRAARGRSIDPLVLLTTWRRERRFVVEQPAARTMHEGLELEAMARVPSLLAAVRAASGEPLVDSLTAAAPGRHAVQTPLLGAPAARRLAAGVRQYAPPQSPIVTAVRHHGPALVASGDASSDAARRALVEHAVNEESLVAEVALVSAREGTSASTARLVAAAGAALRPYSQETPWFPGDGGPSEDELRREFGIAAVRFDDGVPRRWRPYYRRMLGDGLRDLRRILPALSLDGARVRFRSGTLGGATLAMHDPGSRTIHLPIATSAGAIAHEVAHDLDWQMGRKRYERRGSYGTDVVVREQDGRLAASLRGLTSAQLIPPSGANGSRPPDDVRPAEVFARTLDWFVSIALAREGRVNGYLSAVQDEVLSGHVAVLPRDASGWSAEALAGVLEEMTLVGAPLREWLLGQWGTGRVRRPYALAREIIATPIRSRGKTTSSTDAWLPLSVSLCPVRAYDTPSRARAALAELAAEARARGALRARAARYAEADRPPWAESLLGQGPWSPHLGEEAVQRVAMTILSELAESGAITSAFGWADAAADEVLWRVTSEAQREAGCD